MTIAELIDSLRRERDRTRPVVLLVSTGTMQDVLELEAGGKDPFGRKCFVLSAVCSLVTEQGCEERVAQALRDVLGKEQPNADCCKGEL